MIKNIILLVFAYILMLLIDFSSLYKEKKGKKIFIIYFSLIFIGFTISLLQIIDKAPPSPAIYIERIVRSIFY